MIIYFNELPCSPLKDACLEKLCPFQITVLLRFQLRSFKSCGNKIFFLNLLLRVAFTKCYKFRNSHQRCSVTKGVLRNVAKFTGKHLCQSLFLNNVAGLRQATLLKQRLWHRCFPLNFAKFLRTLFLQSTSRRLLL